MNFKDERSFFEKIYLSDPIESAFKTILFYPLQI